VHDAVESSDCVVVGCVVIELGTLKHHDTVTVTAS
jgi:hypothetical protein